MSYLTAPDYDEILAAYASLDLHPTWGTWRLEIAEGRMQCCPLSAVLLHRGISSLEDDPDARRIKAYRAWGKHWVDGFIAGWDDTTTALRNTHKHTEWQAGFHRGRDAARATGRPIRA